LQGCVEGAIPDKIRPLTYLQRHLPPRHAYCRISGSGFRSLEENQRVSYTVTKGPKGPQAADIQRL